MITLKVEMYMSYLIIRLLMRFDYNRQWRKICLCPFHYFGITDLAIIGDNEEANRDFSMLTSDERVKHIIDQADYYGYSGDKVKGLIFCSSIRETEELSAKFNHVINPATGKKFRTIALNGSSSEPERQNAFERLAMNEGDTTADNEPLDYIFSVEILNEGVDIIEVNQVIMLRPTQSPIVFIQQLGRGLRKADGKEYVVILDFIGNYHNNFMIPIALIRRSEPTIKTISADISWKVEG